MYEFCQSRIDLNIGTHIRHWWLIETDVYRQLTGGFLDEMLVVSLIKIPFRIKICFYFKLNSLSEAHGKSTYAR